MESPLLESPVFSSKKKMWNRALWFLLAVLTITIVGLIFGGTSHNHILSKSEHNSIKKQTTSKNEEIVESERGVVAADDGRCSEIGADMLRQGGHAVDAAVATALCLGVVNPMASGIGGGGFMIVQSSDTMKTQAYDLRETAPLASSESMYEKNPKAKSYGVLSMGVPGEIAGLHEAWSRHGRLPWKTLFQPAIKLAKQGFTVAPYLALAISSNSVNKIMPDLGLRQVYAPNGKLLQIGDTCYNVELGRSLEAVAEQGPKAFYDGIVGEKLVKDVKEKGGILTMEDLRNYKVEVMDAMAIDVMGYTVYGMPPPSSGTLGLSLVLNIIDSYKKSDAANGSLGLHRLIEALKHMFAIRMSLGDPDFVNMNNTISAMLSRDYAEKIRQKIFDNTTFSSDYYMYSWSQLNDHGTSHFCIVDGDRNAVSMTTTVNYGFGAGILSPSTGIVLNNEMDDFSMPSEVSPDKLPPAPSNFIKPNKRPLSSMTPIVVTKDNHVVGVLGGSGGMYIIPAVVQVFLNHFILGMDPLAAVQSPRVYHKLIPNVVLYENWTVIDGEHFEIPEDRKLALQEKGHQLAPKAGGAICQLVVHTLKKTENKARKLGHESGFITFPGTLTAVSDPRKDGKPAAV